MSDTREVGLNTPEAIGTRAELYGLVITFVTLAAFSLTARLYVRIQARNQGLEDWLVVAAMFMLLIKTALNAIMIENGLGLQAENLQPQNFEMIGIALYAAMVEYCLAIGLVRLSILVMYRRIFDTRGMRISVNILGIITVIWVILFIGLGVFQCVPIRRAWNPTIPGQCLNIKALFIGNAVPNIVTDIVMVALPIYPVTKLRLPLAQRIAVIAIFLLGGIVCIASIYRLTTVPGLDPMNLAFTVRGAAIFGHVETAVAIMSACLPTLRPLFSRFLYAVGITNTSHIDQSGSKGGGRSRTSTLSSYASRKAKNGGFAVIIDEDGPKLGARIQSQRQSPEDEVVRKGVADAVPMDVIHVRRDVDLEIGRTDAEPSISQPERAVRKEWHRAGANHVVDQYRRS